MRIKYAIPNDLITEPKHYSFRIGQFNVLNVHTRYTNTLGVSIMFMLNGRCFIVKSMILMILLSGFRNSRFSGILILWLLKCVEHRF